MTHLGAFFGEKRQEASQVIHEVMRTLIVSYINFNLSTEHIIEWLSAQVFAAIMTHMPHQ